LTRAPVASASERSLFKKNERYLLFAAPNLSRISWAALVDVVLWTAVTIQICLVFLYQGKPHPCHLQENDSALLILGATCHFQALCGEATELVRRAHGTSPNCQLLIRRFRPFLPMRGIDLDRSPQFRINPRIADATAGENEGMNRPVGVNHNEPQIAV
jgi:hypothetical protein